ncbi:MAG: polysaccharide deacetylase family protein, partial [Clostridia bacterium]|nr:polysaccharide deacetylase family protein [Clostridia bacterium]
MLFRGGITLTKRRFIEKKTFVLAAVAVICLLCGVFATDKGKAAVAAALQRQLPIYCVEKQDNVVSLTFDAAWGNEDTQTLIDVLGSYGVKATFFVVGEWAEKYPESVKALSDAGHEVMNHSNRHDHFSKLSSDAIIADINECSDKIENITGVRPILFRPPYGDYNDNVIKTVNGMGMYPVQWDVDSLDWKDIDAQKITKRVLDKVQKGSIVLF